MKIILTYSRTFLILALSACIPSAEPGAKCLTSIDCGLLMQCHPDGYCTQSCNINAECSNSNHLCIEGLCQPDSGLHHECTHTNDCPSLDCKEAACLNRECKYDNIVCDNAPSDYCTEEDNSTYVQYNSIGTCDEASSNCVYAATSHDCPGCDTNCLPQCQELGCADLSNQCVTNCTCVPATADAEARCECEYLDHSAEATPQCSTSEEESTPNGYCFEEECQPCLTDAQCNSSSDTCYSETCIENACTVQIEPTEDDETSEGIQIWSLDTCEDLTSEDCFQPRCAYGISETDNSTIIGCMQNLKLEDEGYACSVSPEEHECLEFNGACDADGNCVLTTKADNPECTDTAPSDCWIAQCDNGNCEQQYEEQAAYVECADTVKNDCKIARCNGDGECMQEGAYSDNAENGISCTSLLAAPNAGDDNNSEWGSAPTPDTRGTCQDGACVISSPTTACESDNDCTELNAATQCCDGECINIDLSCSNNNSATPRGSK